MKKGFTLVEMLIVVVVLVTLMTITFRLSSLGTTERKRSVTIERIQRLENCLSGYYAAFGTYPPVKLHGSRNCNLTVGDHGIQHRDKERELSLNWYTDSGDHGLRTTAEITDWNQVKAACKSQPVACNYPYPEGWNEVLIARSELAKEKMQNGEDTDTSESHKRTVMAGYDDGWTTNPGRHTLTEGDWTEAQLFRFGLMSFLLPRYLVMMNGSATFFNMNSGSRQWLDNNMMPANAFTGEKFSDWNAVKTIVENGEDNAKEKAKVANVLTQAVCARWMPNLEQACGCEHDYVLYGINIHNEEESGCSEIFSPGGSDSDSTSGQYCLDGITMRDGWGEELYYYSPKPYQSYTVWSAGPNGRTFPPWVPRESLSASQNQCVGVWTADDIIHMSH